MEFRCSSRCAVWHVFISDPGECAWRHLDPARSLFSILWLLEFDSSCQTSRFQPKLWWGKELVGQSWKVPEEIQYCLWKKWGFFQSSGCWIRSYAGLHVKKRTKNTALPPSLPSLPSFLPAFLFLFPVRRAVICTTSVPSGDVCGLIFGIVLN